MPPLETVLILKFVIAVGSGRVNGSPQCLLGWTPWICVICVDHHGRPRTLLQVRLHSFDQLFDATRALRILCRIYDVHPDVVVDHFSHEVVDGTSRANDEIQDCGTALLVIMARPFVSIWPRTRRTRLGV